MKFIDRLLDLFRPPTTSQTVVSGMNEPPYRANLITVPQLQAILRQAEAGDVEALFSLYRDIIGGHSHLQSELNTRKLAVLGDAVNFVPFDKHSPADVTAAKAAETLTQCPSWTLGRNHLLNASLYPLALVEKTYRAATANALGLRFELAELRPVPFHHLDFTDRGCLRLKQHNAETGQIVAGAYFLPDPARYITHRGHLLTMIPDYWGGPLRACLFWWLFSVMDRDWWMRFLERFGAPFIVGKYNSANPKDKGVLTRAFGAATQLFALVVSKETDVEVKDVATNSHGDAFEKMHMIANRELSKLILGQTMTSEAQAQGLGGSQAAVHNTVRGDIRQFDAATLAATLEGQLVRQFLDFNGLAGRVKIITGSASPEEIKSATESLIAGTKAGLELTDQGIDQFSALGGLPFRRAAAQQPASVPLAVAPRYLPGLFAEALSRRQPLQLPPGFQMPTDAELDAIAASGAKSLGATMQALHAPLRRLILESPSPEALEASLRNWLPDLDTTTAEALITPILTAYLANGAGTARR